MTNSDNAPVGDPSRGLPADPAAYLRGEHQIFKQVEHWVRSEIRRRYPSLRAEEDDLAQIVHTKLLENLRKGRFRHESTLRSYVVGIVNYSAIDRLRVRYRDDAITEMGSPTSRLDPGNPYHAIEAMDEDRLLQQVVLSIPQKCLDLWRMVFVERLPYESIAEKLSVPLGTIKSRMWRCRQKAAGLLRRLRDGDGGASDQ